jgi:inorganic phosphate transporter, PiT family
MAVTTTMCVIGLGWGRVSRRVTFGSALRSGSADERNRREDGRLQLYDDGVTRRVVSTWFAKPILAGAVAFTTFALIGRFHLP